MAHLLIRKGGSPGQRLPLTKDTVVLGRSPDCDIPIPSPSISRQHARLVRIQEKWYIEDMLSRNGTFVNNQGVATRTELKRNDRIRICDFEAVFSDVVATVTYPSERTALAEPEVEELETSSTLTSIATHGSRVFESQPPENLRTILQVGNRLSTTLELDQLLPKLGENLFQVFAQADRCFLVIQDETSQEMRQEYLGTRRPEDEASARFSRTLVRQCIDARQAFLSEDLSRDKRALTQNIGDARMRSVMCTPLSTADDKVFGAIQLDTLDQAHRFTPLDLKLFIGLGSQAAIAWQNAQLYQEMQKREQIERDLELAGQVQLSILPDRLPELLGYQFYSHYAAALEVSGDYFDFITLPQQRLAVTLGDVAGKSLPAAILMAKLSADVRTCLLAEGEAAAALTRLNSMLYRNLRQTDRLITVTIALIDPATHTITLASAGHCTPLLYRHGENAFTGAISDEDTGVPLGVMETPVYGACQLQFEPGDSLVLYTDGVLDAKNAHDQAFTQRGISAAIRKGGPYTAQALGELIVKACEHHAAGRSQYDDITLVSFGRTL
jgi:serine phosphatase RsbU (regulator of sigma subunit)/pSer/pThr/pTyr-binding forkhead associated (FHA) protein